MQFSIKSDKISIISERQELSLQSGAWRHWEVTIRYRNVILVTLGKYLESSGKGRSLPTQTTLWWRDHCGFPLRYKGSYNSHNIFSTFSRAEALSNPWKIKPKKCSRGAGGFEPHWAKGLFLFPPFFPTVSKYHTHGVRWGLKKAETKVSKLQNSVFCLL